MNEAAPKLSRTLAPVGAIAAMAGPVVLAGCLQILGDDGKFVGTGATGGDTGAGGTGGSTQTITPSPECVPGAASAPLADECGVFVSESKGTDTNPGTKASPVRTLPKAVELAAVLSKPVYMCGEAFEGPILLGTSALIYGGIDCAKGWTYPGDLGRTEISAAANQVALRIAPGVDVELHDADLLAANAEGFGSSSIAVIVEAAATLRLFRCDVSAGDGRAGFDAQSEPISAQAGTVGAGGFDACTASQVITPDPPLNDCGAEQSIGGPGGASIQGQAVVGGPGEPGALMNNNGGAAEGSMNPCGAGQQGLAGEAGKAGQGAAGALGSLTAEVGFVGLSGGDGQPGKPGQGGGGGGGSRGGTGAGKCADPAKSGGASGGSGGSGGCGGLGGKGGGGGGASIAIASFAATLILESVKVKTGEGGRGGWGALGQNGGNGALGGSGGHADGYPALSPGCPGGKGADGGRGGTGGGGMGGHSIGIAYKGGSPPDTTGVTFTLGNPGVGGAGEGPSGNGADGIAKSTQSF